MTWDGYMGLALLLFVSRDVSFVGGNQIVPVPGTNQDIFGVKFQDYELTFQYSIGNAESLTRITCGYGEGQLSSPLVFKLPGQAAKYSPGITSTDVVIGDNPNPTADGRLVNLKFTLKRLDENDKQGYYCQLQYKKADVEQLAINSGKLNLKLLEKPQFLSCLRKPGETIQPSQSGDIINDRFQVDERGNMTSDCTVFGVPTPELQCILYNNNGISQQVPMNGNPVKGNLSINFQNINRLDSHVICTAVGRLQNPPVNAGTTILRRNLLVYHRPGPVKDLRLKESTKTYITVRWTNPTDLGNFQQLEGIYVEHKRANEIDYQLGLGVNLTSTGQGSSLPTEYKVDNLQADAQYDIRVRPYNRLGISDASNADTIRLTAEKKIGDTGSRTGTGSSTNSNLIIYIVVPIVVVLVIIVVVAVMCWRKKKNDSGKRYPTSYVEEAVDYPQGPKMYAQVDISQKKKPSEDQRSTSGYPDIIHQAKPPAVKYQPVSNREPDDRSVASNGSYRPAQNPDDSMSPSYEDSRKEYV